MYLLRNFFGCLPRDLFESAYLDGASDFTVFIAHRAAAVDAGDRGARHLPVPLGLERPADRAHLPRRPRPRADDTDGHEPRELVRHRVPVLTAAAFISMALPLVVFFALQRYFVQGILAGSVKG